MYAGIGRRPQCSTTRLPTVARRRLASDLLQEMGGREGESASHLVQNLATAGLCEIGGDELDLGVPGLDLGASDTGAQEMGPGRDGLDRSPEALAVARRLEALGNHGHVVDPELEHGRIRGARRRSG